MHEKTWTGRCQGGSETIGTVAGLIFACSTDGVVSTRMDAASVRLSARASRCWLSISYASMQFPIEGRADGGRAAVRVMSYGGRSHAAGVGMGTARPAMPDPAAWAARCFPRCWPPAAGGRQGMKRAFWRGPCRVRVARGEATYMVADAHAPTANEKSRVNYPKF
jgi:hypothetical protein